MPQYVVRLEHTSDQCPGANAKVRERVLKGTPEIPKVAQKLGIKILVGPLVLATQHQSFAVVETDKIETVNEFVLQTGLMQWNTVEVTTVKPFEEAMKDLEKMPPPIY